MGKTAKEKANERRRPNYLRNTQAQGQFSGNETRNYYYSSGSVQRPHPSYHRLRPAAPHQFYRAPFTGELHRGRVSNIPKAGKPLGRRLPNKKILSPLRRTAGRKMQSTSEEQKETTSEPGHQPDQQHQQQSREDEHSWKNGPADNKIINEEKQNVENGLLPDAEEHSEKGPDQGSLEDVNPVPKTKPGTKDKKMKRSDAASKSKGKHSPKMADKSESADADKKSERAEVDKKSDNTQTEADEIQMETKDKKAMKKVRKEIDCAQEVSVYDIPIATVKILRLNTEKFNTEMNDSILETPFEDSQEKEDVLPSTSSDWPVSTRASSRRSTRLQEQRSSHDESVCSLKKEEDAGMIILENNPVYVGDLSRSSTNISFAEALINMKGRRSIRPLSPLSLSTHQHFAELQSSLDNKPLSSRMPSDINSLDRASQALKGSQTRSFTSVSHKSSKIITTTTTTGLAADNDLEDSANDSVPEESEELESAKADLSVAAKRKISNPLEEMHQESKRFKSAEEQSSSSDFPSIPSPMNAFASSIKSGKSSTPINMVKVSTLDQECPSHLTDENQERPRNPIHDVSEITDENGESFIEKENTKIMVADQNVASERKWCVIM